MPSQDQQAQQNPEIFSGIPVVNREQLEAEYHAKYAPLHISLQEVQATEHAYLVAQSKALRVSIDASIKEAQALAARIARGNGGRECALAITKLQEGKMWIGKVLEELGHKFPEEYRDEAK